MRGRPQPASGAYGPSRAAGVEPRRGTTSVTSQEAFIHQRLEVGLARRRLQAPQPARLRQAHLQAWHFAIFASDARKDVLGAATRSSHERFPRALTNTVGSWFLRRFENLDHAPESCPARTERTSIRVRSLGHRLDGCVLTQSGKPNPGRLAGVYTDGRGESLCRRCAPESPGWPSVAKGAGVDHSTQHVATSNWWPPLTGGTR